MADHLSENAARIATDGDRRARGAHARSRARSTTARSCTCPTAWRRRSTPTTRTRSTWPAGTARTSGTSTAPSTSTSTAASASTSSGHAHPKIVEAIEQGGAHRHALRHHHADHRGAGRGAVPSLQPRVGALRQLRHRGDDGRHPHRPRRHRSREGAEDRGFVPRSPRHRHVLGRPQRRRHGRARPARVGADVEGHPGGARRVHAGRPVQRRRSRSSRCSTTAAARSPASSWNR